MTGAPEAHLQHALPGRFRLRVPELRGDERRLDELGRGVAGLTGVVTVRPNARTGSLVVHHRGTRDALLQRATEHGILRWDGRDPGEGTATEKSGPRLGELLAERLERAARSVDPSLEHLIEARPSMLVPLFGALAALALYRLAGGHVLPSATSLATDALQLLRSAAQMHPDAGKRETQ